MNPIGPPVWVTDLAARFWADAGEPPPFPRDLEDAVASAGGMTVVRRGGLRVCTVVAHCLARKVPAAFTGPDRPLRAALHCWAGVGTVFLDPADPPDEQRFSFAHELAHFLRDYLSPRRQVAKTIGPDAVDVLDGLRPPTPAERLHAVLRNRPLTPHCHFMSRDPAGRPERDDDRRAEADADRLACELLAPAELFQATTDRAELNRRLTAEFGLPASVAAAYTRLLLPPPDPVDGLFARLMKSR
jgi:hypothetical protein